MKIRRILLIICLLACTPFVWGQADSVGLWDAVETADEENYTAYFRPTVTGNGDYLPMGQLARSLIGVRFRPRGYDYRYQNYTVGGLELADPTDGFPYWNIIAAIEAMPRTHRDAGGLSPDGSGLGGLDGVTDVSLTDRFIPSGGRLSYALTNRTYRHRATASYRAVYDNDWGFSAGISGREGPDGYVKGVASRRADAAATVFKHVDNQTFSLLTAATDSRQGVRSAATQEVYDLARTNYYNPNWGLQNGEIRPARERTYRQVFGALTWQGRLNDRWEGEAAAAFFGGENGYSLPAWYDAPTPYADYYRSLPGFFFDSETANTLRQSWFEGDPTLTQIDWRHLYEANAYNLDANGVPRAHYILRELVTDKRNIHLHSTFRYHLDDRWSFRGGIRARSDRSENFSRLKDLLGAGYWLDIDQYLLDDEYYGAQYQNDMQNPDRPVFEGQKFGYNYRMRSNSLKINGSAEYRNAAWEFYAGAEAGLVDFQREGLYEKEMFPGNGSLGKSEKIDFKEVTAKAGAFWNPSLRQRIGVQVMGATRAPLVKNLFLSPQFRNAMVAAPRSVRIAGAEVVYQWRSPALTVDIAGYLTLFQNDSEIRSQYDDIAADYVDLALTGIAKRHGGVELGAEWTVTPRFSLLGALSLNAYTYINNPTATLTRNSDGAAIAAETAWLKGLHLAGTPQTAALLQFNYRTREGWRFELAAKQTARNYVEINPIRRMNRALDRAGSPEAAQAMIEQERLEDAFLLGLAISKTFRLPGGNRVGLWIHADNLTNNQSIRYAGFEQGRLSRTGYDGATLVPFPAKYYYAYGLNVYAQISYQF